jgi:hypothetical protein
MAVLQQLGLIKRGRADSVSRSRLGLIRPAGGTYNAKPQ